MDKFPHNVFLTGGAGTLGKAIIGRSKQEGWDTKFTVFSRDAHKHDKLNRMFPDVKCIIGDIRDTDRLADLMVGFDLVIHAAAIKHIPQAEQNVDETISINVQGSISVAIAAIAAGIKQVVGISTDKVCGAANVYGATKYLMEKLFQSFSNGTKFNLVRYGNVIGSVGSVVEVWRDMLKRDGVVRATDPDMTRFWITPDQAVTLILKSLDQPAGTILIPWLPATTMRQLAEYVLPEGTKVEYTGLRPGEKRHEEMLTQEEGWYAEEAEQNFIRLWPLVTKPMAHPIEPLVSNKPAYWLTKSQVLDMLGET